MSEAPYILIVEDEFEIRDMLAEMLGANYRVSFAANGQEALELFEGGIPFALVLSDIKMPVMDGIRLFEEIRARGASIPFVFLTAFGDQDDLVRALRLGAFDFILKPFVEEPLKRTVRAAVESGLAILSNARLLESIAIEGGVLERISKKMAQNDNTGNVMRLRNKRNSDSDPLD